MNQSSGSSCNGRVRFEGLLESKEVHEVRIENGLVEWGQALSDEEMGAALERRFLELQPPPCCIVSDMFQGWTQDVADKLHVPRHTLFTMPAKDLAFVLKVPELLESGDIPFNDDEGVRRDILLPGMDPILEWRSFTDAGHPHHQFIVRSLSRLTESSSIIVSTLEELEADNFKALRTDYVVANIKVPDIFPILLSNIPRMQRDVGPIQPTGRIKSPRWKNIWTHKLLHRSSTDPLVVLQRLQRRTLKLLHLHLNLLTIHLCGCIAICLESPKFITDTAQVGLRIHRNADDTVVQDEIEKVLKQNVADGGASTTNFDKILQQCCTSDSVPPFQQCCTPASPFTHQTS